MNTFTIVVGSFTIIGVCFTIYFGLRRKKNKDGKRLEDNIIKEKIDKPSSITGLNFKSDKDIRDYIAKEMQNMSLVDASFSKLVNKFISLTMNWVISIEEIKKDEHGNCKVFFNSDKEYSRLEYFFVNPMDFPIINFAKKNDKYKIEAKIKNFDEITLVLDRITKLEKL